VEEHRAGKHLIRVESDDFMTLEFHGPISASDTRAILRAHDQRLLAQGRLFLLCLVSENGGMTPEARAELKHRPKNLPASYIAYVGAPYAKRVILEMLLRATTVLTRAKTTHRFFEHEAEARNWLAAMRALEHHRHAPTSP
jgi:hypothetical protein